MADDTGSEQTISGRDDDLFRPTLGAEPAYDPLPWNPESHFYVAFFGGVVAVTMIAFLNARRLHAGRGVGVRILLLGLAAFALVVGGGFYVDAAVTDSENVARYGRFASRVAGVVLHFLVLRQLTRATRRFHVVRGENFEPLWVPGIGAVILGGIVSAAAMSAVLEGA